MFRNVDYRTQNFSKRIMGNQLSHYYILKEMVEKNYNYIIIFQDDIQLRNDFKKELEKVINNIPENAEIINIAFHKYAAYNQFIPWNLNQRDEEKEMSKININDYVCLLNDVHYHNHTHKLNLLLIYVFDDTTPSSYCVNYF